MDVPPPPDWAQKAISNRSSNGLLAIELPTRIRGGALKKTEILDRGGVRRRRQPANRFPAFNGARGIRRREFIVVKVFSPPFFLIIY